MKEMTKSLSPPFTDCNSALTVQSHRHLGKHRPLGGVFHHLLLPVAPHSSGSRHVRRGKHLHAGMYSCTCFLSFCPTATTSSATRETLVVIAGT